VNIYGEPTCSYAAFAGHLASHSPAAVETPEIWAILETHGIDPAVALAFFHHESACGTKGRAVQTHSWGNLRYHDQYARLPYRVGLLDGFCAYATWTTAALHFADHLLGRDGTDNYHGLTTVAEVVPIWAPTADGNVPVAYIAAVEEFASSLGSHGGKALAKIAIVAGHLRCENMTAEGLCAGRDLARLRASTGSSGERAYTGDGATRLADALKAAGVDARPIDATYDKDTYETWGPDGVIALHYHRDAAVERAMFAAPTPGEYQSATAQASSVALRDRVAAGYAAAVGIPVTQDLVTANMTDLYTWCFIPFDAWALCAELGNANVDTVVLYNDLAKIVHFLRDRVLEQIGWPIPADPPPARRGGDKPLPAPINVKEQIASQLEGIAAQVRALP